MDKATKRLYVEYNDPAPRNRTLFLDEGDRDKYKNFATCNYIEGSNVEDYIGRIFVGDAGDGLERLPAGSVDLIFADPPYNKGKDYGNNRMRKSDSEYEKWNRGWIESAYSLLKPSGSIYICSSWKYSGLFQKILEDYFEVKNRITWRREKGRGSKVNWKNNMEDIWFAVKSNEYTFNIEDVKIRKEVIAPYKENGKPKDWKETDEGRYRYTHPSNIWTDTVVPFWSMHENTPHPTQKPEMILERIIKASSHRGDIVLDPFMGSGTTATVASRLGRQFIGFEINKEYVRLALKRLDSVQLELM